jgi:hypothetical protein
MEKILKDFLKKYEDYSYVDIFEIFKNEKLKIIPVF